MNKFTSILTILLLINLNLFSATPDLEVSGNSTHDLGSFGIKDKKTTSFTLINRSDKPIVITEANVACGCTKVSYSKKPVISNDSTVVTVIFSPKEEGSFYKKIELKHTGATNPTVLSVKGVVK